MFKYTKTTSRHGNSTLRVILHAVGTVAQSQGHRAMEAGTWCLGGGPQHTWVSVQRRTNQGANMGSTAQCICTSDASSRLATTAPLLYCSQCPDCPDWPQSWTGWAPLGAAALVPPKAKPHPTPPHSCTNRPPTAPRDTTHSRLHFPFILIFISEQLHLPQVPQHEEKEICFNVARAFRRRKVNAICSLCSNNNGRGGTRARRKRHGLAPRRRLLVFV